MDPPPKYQKHVFAGDGQSGAAALKTGKQGEDRIIEVPIGTIARDPETGEVFGEVMADGEELVLLQGGRGVGQQPFQDSC